MVGYNLGYDTNVLQVSQVMELNLIHIILTRDANFQMYLYFVPLLSMYSVSLVCHHIVELHTI